MRTVTVEAVSSIAAEILAEVARDNEMFRAAFAAGRALGRQEGEAAADEQWSWAIAGAKRTAERPTFAEIARRRGEVPDRPCGRPGCRSCSVCIRAAWVARHGSDHRGGPVAWHAVREAAA